MANAAANPSMTEITQPGPGITTMEFLQIGDVHYKEATAKTLGDVKDLAFPPIVRDTLSVTPIQWVIRAIASESRPRKFDGILMCGDLTSYGKADEYLSCVKSLVNALDLSKYDAKRLHVVPGNHDVVRSAANGASLFEKFAPFKNAWESVGLPILAVEDPRLTSVSRSKAKAKLISINSSIGCGEIRYLPNEIRDQLETLLKTYSIAKGSLDAAFSIVGETLDTPAFIQDDVNALCEEIQRLEDHILPVLLSHHNLLPQSLLRVEMYTELINSGFVRSRLSKLNRPIVYCHGHIHANPIEVIRSPENSSSAIVCVAAPELSKGFNILRTYYSSKHFPLGCQVRRFEFDDRDGGVVESKYRIRFDNPRSELHSIAHDGLPEFLSKLPDREMRFAEIADGIDFSPLMQNPSALNVVVQESQWLGLIEVRNPEDSVANWIIRRRPQ